VTGLVALADNAARDKRIARQSYSVVRKLDGLPLDTFALYWRDVHGPLCARLPGLGYYVQHHFARDRWANLWPIPEGVRRMDLVLDGAVEIGFADADGEAQFMQASPVLFGDEFNLFAHAIAYNLPQGSTTLVDRQVDGIPNGPDVLHRFHLHLNGRSREAFRPWLVRWTDLLATAPAVQKLRLHLPEPYDNAHPAPPSPHVDHQVSEERARIAVVELGFTSALAARVFFESEEYRATDAAQREAIESVGVFPVSAVYTFIRDGKITTAGLRGSRSAQLIDEIGAANQTRADVTRQFVPAPGVAYRACASGPER
jgi:hypothetical protein